MVRLHHILRARRPTNNTTYGQYQSLLIKSLALIKDMTGDAERVIIANGVVIVSGARIALMWAALDAW